MRLSISITSEDPRSLRADILLAVLSDRHPLFAEGPFGQILGPVKKQFRENRVSAEKLVPLPRGFKAPVMAVFNAGLMKHLEPAEQLAASASAAVKFSQARGFQRAVLLLDKGHEFLEGILAGLLLGQYGFVRYKTQGPENPIRVAVNVGRGRLARARTLLKSALTTADAINGCRDLVNTPAGDLNTDALLKTARRLARSRGLGIRVYEKKTLMRKGYNGLLTVGRAGSTPPRMVVLTYRPKRPAGTHLCIVGKGILFDSGGLCLKPSEDMWTMKGDMAGAAAALYGISAIARYRPAVRVSAVLCLAENLPDSRAARPGDIFKAANGKSVHVENTDAEGRLVLSDGLHEAGKLGATHVVDLATLTHACIVGLGDKIAGLMGNSPAWSETVRKAAAAAGEAVWELPLYEEYRDMLDIHCADINNIGNARTGGAIVAGLFLREFVPPGVSWAHLDIAGPSFTKKKWKYFSEGATGFGVRTLIKLAGHLSAR